MLDNNKDKLSVIVPFYENPHLAERLCGNIIELRDEFKEFEVEFIFINDSPANSKLRKLLEEAKIELEGHFTIQLIHHDINQGFIFSVNEGFKLAEQRRAHALILNSDTVISPNAVSEMYRVMMMDPMTAFVNPRSNNATICSLPVLESQMQELNIETGFKAYSAISSLLEERQYVPTGVGFCLLIRNIILTEFGFFDPIYRKGFNEENDLIARSNRCGFRAVLANHSFVYHEGSASFGNKARNQLEQKNAEIMLQRYPEFQESVSTYFDSATYKFEKLLSDWSFRSKNGNEFHVAIDCHAMVKAYNGTFKGATEKIKALAKIRGDWQLSVLCAKDVAEFHGLDKIPGIVIIPYENAKGFDVLIKFGQPFSLEEYQKATHKALKLIYMMLDTISWDCNYLRSSELDTLWSLTAELSDGLIFNSHYTQKLFNLRFKTQSQMPQLGCPLSLYYEDYYSPSKESSSLDNDNDVVLDKRWKRNILVFGNQYHHKFLIPTLEKLSDCFQEFHFFGFGLPEFDKENVTPVRSGSLSNEKLERLYIISDAVIFPSMYEGFGLPITEGLARNKVVFARDSELNREILNGWVGPGVLVLYTDTKHLIDCLNNYDISVEQAIENMKKSFGSESKRDWNVVALEIRSFIEKVSKINNKLLNTKKRLSFYQSLHASKNNVQEKSEIEAIKKSLSWRVTSPLRWLYEKLVG